ncbi:hypothetical protein G3N57_04190 [Paraburkholderia sp. Se-20369]|nr:hypothetical protein [Paraburkholderia sp. Se-20369]
MRLNSPHYAIRLHPVTDSPDAVNAPAVTVSVLARPALTGYDRDVRLEAENVAHDFALADIAVEAGELRCLRACDEHAPRFREGFTLSLEDGMAEQLATYLPRIERVSVLAARVRDVVRTALNRPTWPAPWPHERAAIADVVAHVVLDGRELSHAMALAMNFTGRCVFSEADGDDPQYAELGAALRTPEITRLLDATNKES